MNRLSIIACAAALSLAACAPPSHVAAPLSADYLAGRTDILPGGGECNVAARAVYESLAGHDRHYLIVKITTGEYAGAYHVVVVSDGRRIDPLLGNAYTSVDVAETGTTADDWQAAPGWRDPVSATDAARALQFNLLGAHPSPLH